ncbi:creatininase family protein [candidate division KSB1 bacterium]|nr:creatininase family protein [candidate division KSB1 bacterium]
MHLNQTKLMSATQKELLGYKPNTAILPWGATEAHGQHLPYGADAIETTAFAEHSADLASQDGAKVIVLPTIPFGNNAQQLDQVAAIHFNSITTLSILEDVTDSLIRQDIDRLIILNAHGGNEFKPFVRDLMIDRDILIIVINFWQLIPEMQAKIFEESLDHADEMETSLLLYLCPDRVRMNDAGTGKRIPFQIEGLSQPGVWTPRPWTASHPDLGSGNPQKATREKGEQYFHAVCEAIKNIILNISTAKKGDLPYI